MAAGLVLYHGDHARRFGEMEREMTSERTAEAAGSRRGLCVGTVPYGVHAACDVATKNRRLEVEPAEAVYVEVALTRQAIADGLNRLGDRGRAGRIFTPNQISRILAA